MVADGNGGKRQQGKGWGNNPGSGQPPPNDPLINYEIEQALLGGLLCNNALYDRLYHFLKPDHFADALHGRIYDAVGRLVAQGKRADPLTLKAAFDQDKALEDVGGAKYLVQLAQAVVTVLNIEDYAHAIRELSLRREMVALCREMEKRAQTMDYYQEVKPADIAIEFETRLFDITQQATIEQNLPVPASVYIEEAAQQLEEAYKRKDAGGAGLSTGLDLLDEIIGGLMPAKLYILAGRPSMGKSSLAISVSENVAKTLLDVGDPGSHRKVLFFSPEMPRTEVGVRQLAMEAEVSGFDGLRGKLSPEDLERVFERRHNLASLPIFLDETASLGIAELCMKARQYHRKYGLHLIVVDYLQLVHPSRNTDNRANDIASMTRALKTLAKDLGVPVLVLSQLSRKAEERGNKPDDKRPQMQDLRESGAIEQDADVIMFVFRRIYYLERAEPSDVSAKADWIAECDNCRDLAEVIVAKQRFGPIGTAHVRFNEVTTRFSNRPKFNEPPPPSYDGPEDQADLIG